MAIAEINGIPIRYEDSGGDGPALLFSHGFLMDHTMFDAQVAHLAENYRCIRWDERGFGDTPAPGEFNYWDSAGDAVGVLDACGVEQAVWIGMSQGGFLSLRGALASPQRVRGLVLIDSQAAADPPEAVEGYRAMLGGLTSDDDAVYGGTVEMVSGMILGDPDLAAEWIPRWAARRDIDLTMAAGALIDRDDIHDRLGEISCPALIVHGTADQAIPLEAAHAVAASLPDCRGVIEVEGAAHAPNMTHPDIVNAALTEFLTGLA
ncbi:MAG: alpha/beta hydrolase [Actinomycetia bacterium]|nr:alpha/beta hydrolase [Actinomycetes bacterium]